MENIKIEAEEMSQPSSTCGTRPSSQLQIAQNKDPKRCILGDVFSFFFSPGKIEDDNDDLHLSTHYFRRATPREVQTKAIFKANFCPEAFVSRFFLAVISISLRSRHGERAGGKYPHHTLLCSCTLFAAQIAPFFLIANLESQGR